MQDTTIFHLLQQLLIMDIIIPFLPELLLNLDFTTSMLVVIPLLSLGYKMLFLTQVQEIKLVYLLPFQVQNWAFCMVCTM